MLAILNFDIPMFECPDKLGWLPSPNGAFSVKSSYHFDQCQNFEAFKSRNVVTMSKVWKSDIHERSKEMLGRCYVRCPQGSILLTNIVSSVTMLRKQLIMFSLIAHMPKCCGFHYGVCILML